MDVFVATESDMVTIVAFAKVPLDAARVKNRSGRSVDRRDRLLTRMGFIGAHGASVRRKVRALDGGGRSIEHRASAHLLVSIRKPALRWNTASMTPSRHAASLDSPSGGAPEARAPLEPASNGDAGKVRNSVRRQFSQPESRTL
ncbi:hypothetical protein [Caballeronia sp. J97]|uniref:hypothetical protein n=1 Tax=Caballeronia sp. J97 TaxID=2805429 RepID=UPI002AB25324|nr:hypothetical protein [Caballeronia sp. J97]